MWNRSLEINNWHSVRDGNVEFVAWQVSFLSIQCCRLVASSRDVSVSDALDRCANCQPSFSLCRELVLQSFQLNYRSGWHTLTMHKLTEEERFGSQQRSSHWRHNIWQKIHFCWIPHEPVPIRYFFHFTICGYVSMTVRTPFVFLVWQIESVSMSVWMLWRWASLSVMYRNRMLWNRERCEIRCAWEPKMCECQASDNRTFCLHNGQRVEHSIDATTRCCHASIE